MEFKINYISYFKRISYTLLKFNMVINMIFSLFLIIIYPYTIIYFLILLGFIYLIYIELIRNKYYLTNFQYIDGLFYIKLYKYDNVIIEKHYNKNNLQVELKTSFSSSGYQAKLIIHIDNHKYNIYNNVLGYNFDTIKSVHNYYITCLK